MSVADIATTGRFAALDLPFVLSSLLDGAMRGRIKVVQRNVTRYLWFAGRTVLGVTSGLDSERFGSWLVERGLLEREKLGEILKRKTREQRLGRLLVDQHLVPRETIVREIEALSFTLAARMLCEDGEFELEQGWRLPDDAAALRHEVTPLFVTATRRSVNVGQLLTLLGGRRRFVAVRDWKAVGALQPTEQLVLNFMREPLTLDELQRASGLDGQMVALALVALVVSRAVEPCAANGGERVWSPETARASTDSRLPPANRQLRQLLEQIEAEHGEASPEVRKAEAEKARGLQLLAAGDTRNAYRLLRSAVQIAPDADTLVKVADIELNNPLWRQRALDHLRQAVDMAPRCTPAWVALGNYWSLRGQTEKQRRCLEKVLAYEPANDEVRRALELL